MKKLFKFKQISLNQVTGVSLDIAQKSGRIKHDLRPTQRKSVDIWTWTTYITCFADPDEDCSWEETYVPVIIY